LSAPPIENLFLRQIEPTDNVRRLDLLTEECFPLKNFLRRDAKKFHQANVARTYVLVDDSSPAKIWAYITLIASEIKISGSSVCLVDDCTRANGMSELPAVKIARLAVDHRLEGNGLGEYLINFSISIAQTEIMPKIGCRFIIVDAKQSAVKYYEKRGFTLLDTEDNKKGRTSFIIYRHAEAAINGVSDSEDRFPSHLYNPTLPQLISLGSRPEHRQGKCDQPKLEIIDPIGTQRDEEKGRKNKFVEHRFKSLLTASIPSTQLAEFSI